MSNIFGTFVYEPLYNILILLYHYLWNDLGLAIVALTLIIKFLMLSMSKRQIKSQKEIQKVQPLLKELQEKYKDNREELGRKTLELYKEHNINPAAGCLPLIVQMIVFITLYRMFINLLVNDNSVVNKDLLYSITPHIDKVNDITLGFLNLAEPSYVLAIITAAAQYYQMKMMQKINEDKAEKSGKKPKTLKEIAESGKKPSMQDFSTIMSKQMTIFVPVMTLIIGFTFPAGLALYWFVSTIFSIVQQWFVLKEK